MSKSSQKAQQIFLDYLKDHPGEGISARIFNELANTNSRTVFLNVRKDLEEYGYEFESYKVGKEAFYRITNNTESYTLATSDDFYKYIILETLNLNRKGMIIEDPVKRAERRKRILSENVPVKTYPYIMDKLYNIQTSTSDYDDDAIPVNISETKLRDLLNQMVEDGQITVSHDKKYGNIYRPNNKEAIFSTQQLTMALQILNQIPKKHKNYPILSSAKDKIAIELFHRTNSKDDDLNYIVYGKKRRTFNSITEDLQVLSVADYKKHIVEISYENGDTDLNILIGVGIIVFSEISSETYIIGKIFEEETYLYIPLSSVKKVSSQEALNHEYGNEIYYSMLENMLDVSVKQPVNFKAKITTDYLDTGKKFLRIQGNRSKTSSINSQHKGTKEMSIIYNDSISDLDNIESYLMSYGRACKIIEPESLRQKFENDIRKSLENYRKEGFDVE